MADKKKEKNAEAKPAAEKSNKSSRKAHATIFTAATILMAAVFSSSAILLAVGMMPTFTVLFVDPMRARTKVVTVGALNLAGCVPFLLELWKNGHEFNRALDIIADPMAIIVMYAAAAIGYQLDWALSAVVAGILYQRGQARQEAIRRRQNELIERWGVEVTGQVPLDQYGFAVNTGEDD